MSEGGLFVPPGDARALAAAVRGLADNPGLARAMGIAARKYVLQHFEPAEQGVAPGKRAVRLSEKR